MCINAAAALFIDQFSSQDLAAFSPESHDSREGVSYLLGSSPETEELDLDAVLDAMVSSIAALQ